MVQNVGSCRSNYDNTENCLEIKYSHAVCHIKVICPKLEKYFFTELPLNMDYKAPHIMAASTSNSVEKPLGVIAVQLDHSPNYMWASIQLELILLQQVSSLKGRY